MDNAMHLHYIVDGSDFPRAGEISSKVKKQLKQLGLSPETIRRVAIAMYEAEINMVIHASGGVIDVTITPSEIHFSIPPLFHNQTAVFIKQIFLFFNPGGKRAVDHLHIGRVF